MMANKAPKDQRLEEVAGLRAECEAPREREVAALAELREVARFLDEMPYLVLRVDGGGGVLYANDAGSGLVREPAVSAWWQAVQEALAEGTPRTVEAACGGREWSLAITPAVGRGYANVYGTDVTERKRAEREAAAAARAAEQLVAEVQVQRTLLDTIIENLPVGIGIADAPSGRLVRINEETRRIWHLASMEAGDASGYGKYVGFHPDGRPYASEDWQLVRALRGEVIHGEELSFLRGDGTRGTMRSSAAPVRDPAGNVVAAVVVIDDITEKKRAEAQREAAEEALRRSEERLHALFDVLPVGLSILDERSGVVAANEMLASILELPAGQMVAGEHRQRSYLRPDGTPLPPEEFATERAFREQRAVQNVEIGVVKEDGETIWTSVSASPVSLPDAAMVVATVDITARKRAEDAARAAMGEAERRAAELEAVLAAIPDGLVIAGPDSRYERVNEAAQRMFGMTPDYAHATLDGRLRMRRFVLPDGRPAAEEDTPLWHALHGQTVLNEIIGMAGGDEGVTWISCSAAPLRGSGAEAGTIAGAVASFVDVTKLRRAEQRVQEANAELQLKAEELSVQAEQLAVQNAELRRLSAELADQRSRLEAVMATIPGGVAIFGPDGKIVHVNEFLQQLLDLAPDYVAGPVPERMQARHWVNADGRPLSAEELPLAHALRGETVRNVVVGGEVRGEMTWVQVSAAPLLDPAGSIGGAVASYADVSGLRRAQERLEEMAAELEVQADELRSQNEELTAAQDELRSMLAISHHLAAELELEPLLKLVLDEVDKRVGYSTLCVYGLEGEVLTLLEYRGPLPRQEAVGLTGPLASSWGLARAVDGRAPLVISNVNDRSKLARDWKRSVHPQRNRLMPGTRSLMAVPLLARGRTIGVLSLTHVQPGYYTDRKADWAVALASAVAVALDNARLYGQVRELAVVQERQRLARDLHDVVSQTLFSAGLTADVLPRIYARDPERGQLLLDELRRTTRGALAELRTLLAELRPQALVEADLGTLLGQLADAAAGRSATEISLSCEGRFRLPEDVQVALYRIAQEALHNVAKHARAEHATLHLVGSAEADGLARQVELCIADDGIGFDVEHLPGNEFGLSIMRERAQSIGAALTIDSRPAEGTRITAVWGA